MGARRCIATLLALALLCVASAQVAPSTLVTINVETYFQSVSTISGTNAFVYLCQPSCEVPYSIEGIKCVSWKELANCGQDYDMNLVQYPIQMRFGDPFQPEEWGTSGIGLTSVNNFPSNSWRTLEPFQMLSLTHFNAPIDYSSSITGFSITVSVTVKTVPSTDNDSAVAVTTVKNFTIPYLFAESIDDCVSQGGFASAGCPWNDPEKWENGTLVMDTECQAFNGVATDWRLPSGESCCPYFTTQKADTPAGCSDYLYQTVTMDPQYAVNADGAFVIPDYVPIDQGKFMLVNQEYTVNFRGFDLQGRTSPPIRYVISDERQDTDALIVVQFVRNCPPIGNCQSGRYNDDPEGGNCTCYVDPSQVPWCPCHLQPEICNNGTCVDRTSASDPCICDCTNVNCTGNREILSIADNCECKCNPNRCANSATLLWNDTMCPCVCIDGFCQAVFGPNFIEDEFCNCTCGITNDNCTMGGLYPTKALLPTCECGCTNTCNPPFVLNVATCMCECPVTQQLELTNCLLDHNIFNTTTCQCDNTECQGDFVHPYPPLPPGPPPDPYVPPPTPPGPCSLCLIAPNACGTGTVLNNDTCQCNCPTFDCTDPLKQIEINCFCKACSHDGSPDGLGYCECGNGVVEDGEDCDGGPGGDPAECCDALTCKWLDLCSGTDPLVDNCFLRTCLPNQQVVPGRPSGESRLCTPLPRCNQSSECFSQTCNSDTGACVDVPNDEATTPCGERNMCVQQCRQGRYCQFIEPDCPTPEELQAQFPFPAYQCYTPVCDPLTGICAPEFLGGAPCENGNITERVIVWPNLCSYQWANVTPSLAPNGDCYSSVCDGNTCVDVFLEGKACLPSDLFDKVGIVNIQCYTGMCTSGVCQVSPTLGRTCDDGLSCSIAPGSDVNSPLGSITDLCVSDGNGGAMCTGGVTPCDDVVADRNCTVVSCEETVSGFYCRQTPKPYGTPCDDGYDCTTDDVCGQVTQQQAGGQPVLLDTGVCAGTPLVCVSNSTCIQTRCDEDIGGCVYSAEVMENKYCELPGAPVCHITQCRSGQCVMVLNHCTTEWYNRKAAVITTSVILFLLLLAGLVAGFMLCRGGRGGGGGGSAGPALQAPKSNLKDRLLD